MRFFLLFLGNVIFSFRLKLLTFGKNPQAPGDGFARWKKSVEKRNLDYEIIGESFQSEIDRVDS